MQLLIILLAFVVPAVLAAITCLVAFCVSRTYEQQTRMLKMHTPSRRPGD